MQVCRQNLPSYLTDILPFLGYFLISQVAVKILANIYEFSAITRTPTENCPRDHVSEL